MILKISFYNCDLNSFMGWLLYGCDAQVAGIIMLWILAIGYTQVFWYFKLIFYI